MFLAGKKVARVLVLGIALLGAATGAHTMAEAAGGLPGGGGAAAAAAAAAPTGLVAALVAAKGAAAPTGDLLRYRVPSRQSTAV